MVVASIIGLYFVAMRFARRRKMAALKRGEDGKDSGRRGGGKEMKKV